MSNRSPARFWLTIVVLALVTGSAWQEVNLSQAEVDTALETHLPFGQPRCPRLLPPRECNHLTAIHAHGDSWAQFRAQSMVARQRDVV
jgi:uncharacterized iron-regulated membrane protein